MRALALLLVLGGCAAEAPPRGPALPWTARLEDDGHFWADTAFGGKVHDADCRASDARFGEVRP